jgi:hypothetical protein
MIFAILYSYNFMLAIDTIVLNNDNEISLHFNPLQSNFSANRILPSFYLFWAVKRLVDYL